MSKKEEKRWKFKVELKRLSIEHTKQLERLAVIIALCLGGLLILYATFIVGRG